MGKLLKRPNVQQRSKRMKCGVCGMQSTMIRVAQQYEQLAKDMRILGVGSKQDRDDMRKFVEILDGEVFELGERINRILANE